VDFLHFQPNKIRVRPIDVISSLFPHQCRLSSDRRCHATASYHVSFPLSQDAFIISALSFGNVLSCRILSRAKTETLISHNFRRLLSLKRPDSHHYKKIISTLTTLSTTQSYLHFTFSLVKAPCYLSFTYLHYSLSPMSYTYRPSTQQHSRQN
jgi:hypothetical protein